MTITIFVVPGELSVENRPEIFYSRCTRMSPAGILFQHRNYPSQFGHNTIRRPKQLAQTAATPLSPVDSWIFIPTVINGKPFSVLVDTDLVYSSVGQFVQQSVPNLPNVPIDWQMDQRYLSPAISISL